MEDEDEDQTEKTEWQLTNEKELDELCQARRGRQAQHPLPLPTLNHTHHTAVVPGDGRRDSALGLPCTGNTSPTGAGWPRLARQALQPGPLSVPQPGGCFARHHRWHSRGQEGILYRMLVYVTVGRTISDATGAMGMETTDGCGGRRAC